VSARIHVLSRSLDNAPGYTDNKTYTLGTVTLGPYTGADAGYKRHAFSGVVRLVLPAEETP
jgi:type IV pilus assembly protein PilW